MNKIKNYYFTYGTSDSYPFKGGWTKIEAPSKRIAIAIFREYHPDTHKDIVNCCSIYEEEQFHKTSMWSKGNFGKHEVEIITMQYFNTDVPFDI